MSLLEIGDGVVEVKATSGDNHLGGDDWDSRIVDWMIKKFKDNNGVDLGTDKIAKQRLQEAAEKAKIELKLVDRDHGPPAVHHPRRERPAALRGEAERRSEFQRTHLRPARAHQGAVQVGASRTRVSTWPRSTTSSSSVARPGCRPSATWCKRAHRRQGAQQGRQPRRGRRGRRSAAGRRAQGRGQGRAAPRRHPALPRHRDQGRRDDQAHRAQHDDPDQEVRGLHDR